MERNDTILRQAGASTSMLVNHPVLTNYKIYGLTWMQLAPLDAREAANELPSEVLCVPNSQTETTLGMLQKAGFKLC